MYDAQPGGKSIVNDFSLDTSSLQCYLSSLIKLLNFGSGFARTLQAVRDHPKEGRFGKLQRGTGQPSDRR
jgi:hypothetical protein